MKLSLLLSLAKSLSHFCLNVSEFIVCFTLGTYMFRGSEENKMKEFFDFHPTRNRVAKKKKKTSDKIYIMLSFYFIKSEILGRLWLPVGHLASLVSISIYLI